MELIVAVYEDWGIGSNGTQPIALTADRKFFRETTRGAMVIVGRRTVEDFPGKKPLPGRENVILTRKSGEIPGFTVCHSVEEAVALAEKADRAMVIGGGTIYKQLLPYCNKAYVTHVGCKPESDTFFPNLAEDPAWKLTETLLSGEEEGISYRTCIYEKN